MVMSGSWSEKLGAFLQHICFQMIPSDFHALHVRTFPYTACTSSRTSFHQFIVYLDFASGLGRVHLTLMEAFPHPKAQVVWWISVQSPGHALMMTHSIVAGAVQYLALAHEPQSGQDLSTSPPLVSSVSASVSYIITRERIETFPFPSQGPPFPSSSPSPAPSPSSYPVSSTLPSPSCRSPSIAHRSSPAQTLRPQSRILSSASWWQTLVRILTSM